MGKVSVNVMVYLCLYIYNKSNMEKYANWYNDMLNSKGVAMEQYINDMLTWDVYNFANMKQKPGDEVVWDADMQKDARQRYGESFSPEFILNRKFLSGLKKQHEGKITFHIPAMLMGPLWFVYRKMYKCAVATDSTLLIAVFLFLAYPESDYKAFTFGVCYLIFSLILGFIALPLYYDHMHTCFEKRGILLRMPVLIERLDCSLRKEGKPSILAVFVLVLLNIIIYNIMSDLVYMIYILS